MPDSAGQLGASSAGRGPAHFWHGAVGSMRSLWSALTMRMSAGDNDVSCRPRAASREQHDQPPGQVNVISHAAATVHMSPQLSLARQAQSAGVLDTPLQLEGNSGQS